MTTTMWYRKRYRLGMAMNLRLPEDLAEALRALAEQTGRSQQDLAREALHEYVRDYPLRAYPKDVRHMITPATRAFGEVDPEIVALLRSLGPDRLAAATEWDREDRI
jgi:plasmid stability protein